MSQRTAWPSRTLFFENLSPAWESVPGNLCTLAHSESELLKPGEAHCARTFQPCWACSGFNFQGRLMPVWGSFRLSRQTPGQSKASWPRSIELEYNYTHTHTYIYIHTCHSTCRVLFVHVWPWQCRGRHPLGKDCKIWGHRSSRACFASSFQQEPMKKGDTNRQVEMRK